MAFFLPSRHGCTYATMQKSGRYLRGIAMIAMLIRFDLGPLSALRSLHWLGVFLFALALTGRAMIVAHLDERQPINDQGGYGAITFALHICVRGKTDCNVCGSVEIRKLAGHPEVTFQHITHIWYDEQFPYSCIACANITQALK